MKFDGVKCDQCGALKKDTNHWFTAFVDAPSKRFLIVVTDDNSESMRYTHKLDLCSESCAAKAMSIAIGAGS